jgi:hypothetical protein
MQQSGYSFQNQTGTKVIFFELSAHCTRISRDMATHHRISNILCEIPKQHLVVNAHTSICQCEIILPKQKLQNAVGNMKEPSMNSLPEIS